MALLVHTAQGNVVTVDANHQPHTLTPGAVLLPLEECGTMDFELRKMLSGVIEISLSEIQPTGPLRLKGSRTAQQHVAETRVPL